MYNIPGLRDKCEELLIEDLTSSNVSEYFQLAFLHDDSKLRSAATRLLINKLKDSPDCEQALGEIFEFLSSKIPK